MNTIETIRAEIERLDKHYLVREYDNGWNDALDVISKFLDTLPKQPASDCRETCKGYQETGKCFVDGPCVAKQETSKEQPVEGLEEELENYAKLYPLEDAGSYRNLITLARHFAEWGAKNAK